MQFSIDGGVTYQAVDEIRIIFSDVAVPPESFPGPEQDEPTGELHIRCTEEGIIHDVWADEECVATQSATISEVVDHLTE